MASRVMLADNKPIKDEQIQALLDISGYLYGQPKIDGMRVHVNEESRPASRSGKIFKHKYLNAWCQDHPSLRGIDGEITPGHAYTEDSFRGAMSSIKAEEGTPLMTYFLFDDTELHNTPYASRLERLEKVIEQFGQTQQSDEHGYHMKLVVTSTVKVFTLEEVHTLAEKHIVDGWEGTMLRRPDMPYKFGRSTNRGGELVKIKRFVDAEAIVVGYKPWQQNNNAPTIDERGYQVRSSHQDGKVPLEMLGTLDVELVTDRAVSFSIGVMAGVSHTERRRLWEHRETLIGRICKFSHQGYGGGYDVPRTPVFLNWRSNSEF